VDRGLSYTEAGRTLGPSRKTVRRYASAADAGELVGGARLATPGLPGPHQSYLQQRWDEGIRSTQKLHEELRGRGYRGSLRTLRRLTAQTREETAVTAAPPARRAATWILTPNDDLTDENRDALAKITARCPELKTTRDLVRGFADMLCRRRGARHLEAWAAAAEAFTKSDA
jgi:hypothetical protein